MKFFLHTKRSLLAFAAFIAFCSAGTAQISISTDGLHVNTAAQIIGALGINETNNGGFPGLDSLIVNLTQESVLRGIQPGGAVIGDRATAYIGQPINVAGNTINMKISWNYYIKDGMVWFHVKSEGVFSGSETDRPVGVPAGWVDGSHEPDPSHVLRTSHTGGSTGDTSAGAEGDVAWTVTTVYSVAYTTTVWVPTDTGGFYG